MCLGIRSLYSPVHLQWLEIRQRQRQTCLWYGQVSILRRNVPKTPIRPHYHHPSWNRMRYNGPLQWAASWYSWNYKFPLIGQRSTSCYVWLVVHQKLLRLPEHAVISPLWTRWKCMLPFVHSRGCDALQSPTTANLVCPSRTEGDSETTRNLEPSGPRQRSRSRDVATAWSDTVPSKSTWTAIPHMKLANVIWYVIIIWVRTEVGVGYEYFTVGFARKCR